MSHSYGLCVHVLCLTLFALSIVLISYTTAVVRHCCWIYQPQLCSCNLQILIDFVVITPHLKRWLFWIFKSRQYQLMCCQFKQYVFSIFSLINSVYRETRAVCLSLSAFQFNRASICAGNFSTKYCCGIICRFTDNSNWIAP